MCECDVVHNVRWNAGQLASEAELERVRPSYLYRPRLYVDGNMWCALMGENIQEGICGFGESPDVAYRAFDKAWYEKLQPWRSLADADRGVEHEDG